MFKENKPEKIVTMQEETNEELVFCDASNLFWGTVFFKRRGTEYLYGILVVTRIRTTHQREGSNSPIQIHQDV